MTDDELIAHGEAVLNPHRVGNRLFGDVAAALRTRDGQVFTGVCIDTGSGTGFCAEHAAIAALWAPDLSHGGAPADRRARRVRARGRSSRPYGT